VNWYVQVASVKGIVSDPEQSELPLFTTQREAAGAAARMTQDQEHLYGWHTVAKVQDEKSARAMAALVGNGIQGDGGMIGRALSESELGAEAGSSIVQAEAALNTPEAEYGRFLERVVTIVRESFGV
jgi:hypothetical protein